MTVDIDIDRVAMREAGQRRAAAARDGGPTAANVIPCGPGRAQSFQAELRAKKVDRDGKAFYLVEGYATVYERGYEMWDWAGPYTEIVSVGAAEETLAANPDVVFLVNHRGLAMARTRPADNATLELSSDSTGMRDRAWLNPQRQDVKDLVVGIDDGVITEQSFAFMITSGQWSPDYSEYRINAFDIHRGDVSAVNYGANPHTSIAARSREILDALDHLPAGAARAAIERLRHRADIAPPRPVDADTIPAPAPPEASKGRSLTQVDAWLASVAAR